jgi:hypothetical protein
MSTFRFSCNIQDLNSVVMWVGIHVYDWWKVYCCYNSSVVDWTVHKPRWKQSISKTYTWVHNHIENKYFSMFGLLWSPHHKTVVHNLVFKIPSKLLSTEMRLSRCMHFCEFFGVMIRFCGFAHRFPTEFELHTFNRILSDLPHHQLPVNSSIICHTQT